MTYSAAVISEFLKMDRGAVIYRAKKLGINKTGGFTAQEAKQIIDFSGHTIKGKGTLAKLKEELGYE